MFWIYDIPNWLFGLFCVATFVVLGVGGLLLSRPFVMRLVDSGDIGAEREAHRAAHNEAVNTYLSVVGIFYGLTLGLISVTVWQSFSDADARVNAEAAGLGSLYRSVSSYSPPARTELQKSVREYTRFTIKDAWPQFQQGNIPTGTRARLTRIGDLLYAFEPRSEGDKIVHAQTLVEFHEVSDLARGRFLIVSTGLPSTLWGVVLIGGALTVGMTFLFVLPSLRVHAILTALTAAMIGLLLFLMGAMDYPFRGGFSVTPEAFEQVLLHTMMGE